MSNDTIPATPAEGGRVFTRFPRERLAVPATTSEGYRRAEALLAAIDEGLSTEMRTLLKSEGVDVLGFELVVDGDATGVPLEVSGAVGLTVVWLTRPDLPVANPSVYLFARQGASGLEAIGSTGDGSVGSLFVGHFDGQGPTADGWCVTVAAPDTLAKSGPSVLLDGEHVTYTPSITTLLLDPEDAWYIFATPLKLTAGGSTLTVQHTGARYRHLGWLLGALGLRAGVSVEGIPVHRYFGSGDRAVPAWSTAVGVATGMFELDTLGGPTRPPSREKISLAERRRLKRLENPEQMRRLRRIESPTGSQPGIGGYLESTEANQARFVSFFEDAIPDGLDITPEDLFVLSSDVERANRDRDEPYRELPPRELWENIVPTLELLEKLGRESGTRFEIKSAYRSDIINGLSDGSADGKHMYFRALDVEPQSTDESISDADQQERFEAYVKHYWWSDDAVEENFALGYYRPGRVHIDTHSRRRWPEAWRGEERPTSERRFQRFFGDDDDDN